MVGFQFPVDDRVTVVRDPSDPTSRPHLFHSRLPEFVFIKKLAQPQPSDITLPSMPDPSIVPVPVLSRQQTQITYPSRRFFLHVQQVPLLPAFAITVDKSQGITLRQLVNTHYINDYRPRQNRPSLYVGFSRVTEPERMRNMQLLTNDPRLKRHPDYLWTGYFTPTQDCLAENERMRARSA